MSQQRAPERLSLAEARGLMLAAQGLLDPPEPEPDRARVQATIERLGVLQVDTISVVERTQYLVLWSRLGAYDPALLDALLHPHRATFEYWSHAASIVPMVDYPFYRRRMLGIMDEMWAGNRAWLSENPAMLAQTLAHVRERGPLASADFERPDDGRRAEAWDWYGVKESRRALQILWTLGDLMIHSRRAGQKVYDLRERVLADVYGAALPDDADLPPADAYLAHFTRRTISALGVIAPAWLWDYFRLAPAGANGSRRQAAAAALEHAAAEGLVVPVVVEGVAGPLYLDVARLPDLERLRAGYAPTRTTLLSPFDSLIWDRARTRVLWNYEVCFEAYVVPEKRRFGYYCLAILHQGRLVGRLDPKMDRAAGRLLVRAIYLEPGVVADAALLDGVTAALRDLARFLGAQEILVEHGEPATLAARLRARLAGRARRAPRPSASATLSSTT
ncbi:MAG TPA: crosslink repair DNA glycosylase YcaQ family protein [Ktedonobacterales bacterium]|nr:crosslink repair DNA glycosylase YcaQ family protein [Ktedonobacterales bacterium]